jgi:hypothetical protein
MVHVYVGPDRKLFIFPETLLCDRFEFFKSAFQSGFRESMEKAIDLPEDDPVAFAYVIDHAFQEETRMTKKVAVEEVQLALAKAYVLADKLGREDIAREAKTEYDHQFNFSRSIASQIVCPRAARYIYQNSSESSTMRCTMVNMAVTKYFSKPCFTAKWTKEWSESATSHPQFHAEIMVEIKKRICQENDDETDCSNASCIVHDS